MTVFMGAVRCLRQFIRLVICSVLVQWPVSGLADEAMDALRFINKARAGLHPLKYHPLLSKAAWHHSRYMAVNRERGHKEQKDLPEFTGETCADRLASAGYPSRMYVENLSSGQASWEQSAEDLMSAIYHRLGFLSFYIDEIGLAKSPALPKRASKMFYSYVMGYSGFRNLCKQEMSGDVEGICSDSQITVDARELYKAKDKATSTSTELVVYPWPGQEDVEPSFINNEQPSPLPGIGQSGQPFSIHFNPVKLRGKSITVLKAELVDEMGETVTLLPEMNQKTDPNGRFTEFDFAWFPEETLKGNAQYAVQLLIRVGRNISPVGWTFRTRQIDQE